MHERHVLIVVLDKPSDFEQLLDRGRVSSEVFERGRCDLGRR